MSWVAVGALVYSALALAVLFPTSMVEKVGERLPGPLLAILLSTVGPIILFSDGIDGWPMFAVIVALLSICLGLARLAWRRSPETEWFAFWLMCAAAVWGGSPWLLAALLI